MLPVAGPSAWRAAEVADTSRWTVQLGANVAGELVSSTLELAGAGLDLDSVAPIERPNALDGPWVGQVHRHLAEIGLALLDGFPVGELGPHAAMAFWRLSSLVGEPLLQNLTGQRIDVVRNEGVATVRGAKTDRELIFHTDFANTTPDVFGLLTVQQAKEGGESLLVSGHAVANALLRERPDVLDVLASDFLFDRTGDVAPDQDQVVGHPVLRWTQDGPRLLYNRARVHRGHREAGVALRPEQLRALNVLDELLNRPELLLRVRMRPGQAIFIDNGWILHSRSAFTDWDEPRRRRELLRVWLGADRPH